MYISDYGKSRMYTEGAQEYVGGKNNSSAPDNTFSGCVNEKESEDISRGRHIRNGGKTAKDALEEEEE